MGLPLEKECNDGYRPRSSSKWRKILSEIKSAYKSADDYVVHTSTRIDAAVIRLFRRSCTDGSAMKVITGTSGNERKACGLSKGCETYSLASLVTEECPYLQPEYRNVKKRFVRKKTWLCSYR